MPEIRRRPATREPTYQLTAHFEPVRGLKRRSPYPRTHPYQRPECGSDSLQTASSLAAPRRTATPRLPTRSRPASISKRAEKLDGGMNPHAAGPRAAVLLLTACLLALCSSATAARAGAGSASRPSGRNGPAMVALCVLAALLLCPCPETLARIVGMSHVWPPAKKPVAGSPPRVRRALQAAACCPFANLPTTPFCQSLQVPCRPAAQLSCL